MSHSTLGVLVHTNPTDVMSLTDVASNSSGVRVCVCVCVCVCGYCTGIFVGNVVPHTARPWTLGEYCCQAGHVSDCH